MYYLKKTYIDKLSNPMSHKKYGGYLKIINTAATKICDLVVDFLREFEDIFTRVSTAWGFVLNKPEVETLRVPLILFRRGQLL
jgi:hypothetical protein